MQDHAARTHCIKRISKADTTCESLFDIGNNVMREANASNSGCGAFAIGRAKVEQTTTCRN